MAVLPDDSALPASSVSAAAGPSTPQPAVRAVVRVFDLQHKVRQGQVHAYGHCGEGHACHRYSTPQWEQNPQYFCSEC